MSSSDDEAQAHKSLEQFIKEMQRVLGTMEDETVLDEEKLALKKLLETLVVQIKETMFSTEFFVEEMLPDLRTGWETALAQAQHLNEVLGEERWGGVIEMAQSMLKLIDDRVAAPKYELKDEIDSLEARKHLTQVRSAVSRADSVIIMLQTMRHMKGADAPEARLWTERQTMEMEAQRDHLLQLEAVVVAGLEKRGERVPKWRRR